MGTLKRIVGVLLLLVGAVGVAACAVAIYKTGVAGNELGRIAERTFDSVENGIADVRDQVNQTTLSLAHVLSNLQGAIRKAESFKADDRDQRISSDQVPVVLGSEVREKLIKARRMLGSAVGAVSALSRLVGLLNTSGLLKIDKRGETLANRVEEVSGNLSRFSTVLDEAIATASDLASQSQSEQTLTKWTRELKGLEKGLSKVQSLESDFEEIIHNTEDRLLHYEENTVRWIRMGGILLPFLLVWLGAGQLALMIMGGRLLFKKRK